MNMIRTHRVACGIASLAVAGIAMVAACGPANAADLPSAGSQQYSNTGGAAMLDTPYGEFGPVLPADVARVGADSGSVNSFTVAGSPVKAGKWGPHISWSNVNVSLVDRETTGTIGTVPSSKATVNATGLQMNISGYLCVTAYGGRYCNVFPTAAPLEVFLSPTPTPNRASVVTATGTVGPNGKFNLDGTAYATVNSSTWTGWALGKLVDGSQLTLNLDDMHGASK